MAELVDALISGVSGETRAGSNPVIRTIRKSSGNRAFFVIGGEFLFFFCK